MLTESWVPLGESVLGHYKDKKSKFQTCLSIVTTRIMYSLIWSQNFDRWGVITTCLINGSKLMVYPYLCFSVSQYTNQKSTPGAWFQHFHRET